MARRSPLGRAWRGFAAPAVDPRTAFPDVYERQLERLKAVRTARAAVAETRARLGDKAELLAGRGILEELEARDRRLALAEERLVAQVEALLGREDAVAARAGAAEAELRVTEALAGLDGDAAGLSLALDQAEAALAELEARAVAVERLLAEDDPTAVRER